MVFATELGSTQGRVFDSLDDQCSSYIVLALVREELMLKATSLSIPHLVIPIIDDYIEDVVIYIQGNSRHQCFSQARLGQHV
jgi:hypothetical protein